MISKEHIQALQNGEVTIAELRGITNKEMEAGISAGRKLVDAGEYQMAAEVLAGLALYDPFRPGVWHALEDLFRKKCLPEQANLFSDLARIMVV